MSELTVHLDDALVSRSREYAESHGLTVDELVASSLSRVIGEEPGAKFRATVARAREMDLRFTEGFMTREEANERR